MKREVGIAGWGREARGGGSKWVGREKGDFVGRGRGSGVAWGAECWREGPGDERQEGARQGKRAVEAGQNAGRVGGIERRSWSETAAS